MIQRSAALADRVLLIGWDAADWKVIHPLMDSGKMPNVQSLVENGSMGHIATLHPVLSPMLWTSIATGKRPYKHGILGFSEPTPDGLNVQPVTNLSRRTKAVWNILNQNEITPNVIGWWPSHPAEPIDGVMVSDMFHRMSIKTGLPKIPRPGAVHPRNLIDELAELRYDLREITSDIILNFVPNARDFDQEQDQRLAVCAKIIAECTTVHSIATHLIETQPWQFMAVYHEGAIPFCVGFRMAF